MERDYPIICLQIILIAISILLFSFPWELIDIMGGRSKQPQEQVDSFSFLSELSNERLENYGNYSSMAFQNRDGSNLTQSGIPSNHDGLNIRAADEYERRNGSRPSWDLSNNGGVAHTSDGNTFGPRK